MQNPFQQAPNGNLNDPLAFVKKLWGDMQLPGMVTPTLSVDELDKQIKDLKTVESWLNVNMNMLKGTIQALEVQRATISALKTMGESFAQASNVAASANDQNDKGDSRNESGGDSGRNHAAWPMHANAHSIPEPTVEENEDELDDEDSVEEERLSTTQKQFQDVSEGQSAKVEQNQFHHPAAWWTVLQDQFKQALSHAMKDETPEAGQGATKAATKAATSRGKAQDSGATKKAVVTKTVKRTSNVGSGSSTSKGTTKPVKAIKAKAVTSTTRASTSSARKTSKPRSL